MSNCIGCKFYDGSVDCCNADEHCYREGFHDGMMKTIKPIVNIIDEFTHGDMEHPLDAVTDINVCIMELLRGEG